MAESAAELIKESATALPAISRHFPVVVSAGSLLFVGLLIWKLVGIQVEVMQEMAKQIRTNAAETRALHDAFLAAGLRVRKAEPAIARDPE